MPSSVAPIASRAPIAVPSLPNPNAKEATELALKDKKQLMEIEFPTAGLESVPGATLVHGKSLGKILGNFSSILSLPFVLSEDWIENGE
ncbi:hypothetical protein L1049_022932 [Liquidambar formosana]|uniref:Uncharacterized protein n=1 Tax=Liquidambar formosana TaxID=63359 RepID=A0AAP0WSF7_LIQFO